MSTAVFSEELKQLFLAKDFISIPKAGDVVHGTVIAISSREVLIDIDGFKTGIIRGYERAEVNAAYPTLQIGDPIEATVLELENEETQVELSLRFAGKTRAWDTIGGIQNAGTPVEVKIVDANRGGLMVGHGNMVGFIPVSQLAPEHYPRVPGGDKTKIFERLREFIGQTLRVKVLDIDPKENKLIFSEKALWEEEQKDLIGKYKAGDVIEGVVSALADFGVFVSFSGLEGLVHISEIAWQRLDNPGDLIKVGDTVRAQILSIQGSKIFLSLRALIDDPWKIVGEKYALGQTVQGRVLKVNPFGLFVELDPEIHGLAHISALEVTPGTPLEQQIQPGEMRTFKVISIEPENHRLGLSEKALRKVDEAPKVIEEMATPPLPTTTTEVSVV